MYCILHTISSTSAMLLFCCQYVYGRHIVCSELINRSAVCWIHVYDIVHAPLSHQNGCPLSAQEGTGMIASSSTFRPNQGRVIRDLFRQLNAVQHCTEALVYRNHPRETAASSSLAIIWLLRSTAEPMQDPHQCRRWCTLWYP